MNILLSPYDAGVVIKNTRDEIEIGLRNGGYVSKKSGEHSSSGSEDYFNSVLDDLIDSYGEDVVGTALQVVRKNIDFTNPSHYYPTRDPALEDWQEEQRQRFKAMMYELIDQVIEQLEGEGDRPLTDEENEEYKSLRKNYSNKKYRSKKKGDLLSELPDFIRVGERTLKDLEALRWFIGS